MVLNTEQTSAQEGDNGAKNWAGTKAGSVAACAVLALEASPLPINEGLRVMAGAWGYQVSHGSSAVASLCAGIATLAIEGGAAVAAADLLDTFRGRRVTDYVREKMRRVGISDGLQTNLPTDISIALLGGSAVVTAVKHQQDPTRTRSENRKYGLMSAGGLSAFTMIETYSVANGFEHPNPLTIAVGALALGAFAGAAKWAKSRMRDKEAARYPAGRGKTPHSLVPNIGGVHEALKDSRTLSIEQNGELLPVLTPVSISRWYNFPYLKKHFGTAQLYSYMHPDTEDESVRKAVNKKIHQVISGGGVVLYGVEHIGATTYGDLSEQLRAAGVDHTKVPTAPEGHKRLLPQYDGLLVVRGMDSRAVKFKETPPIYQVYRQAVDNGTIKFDPQEGPAFVDIIEEREADRLWEIYHRSFSKLSQTHPISVGYSKEEFLQILSDPKQAKVVYRQKGEIVTMTFLFNDLNRCDWLDSEYYAQKYPEATATGNHWVLPGLVTDEKKRGERLSLPLLSLATKVQALTGSDAIISFECTEQSMKYVPRIAGLAIRQSGAGRIRGGFKQVSQLEYYAIIK